MNQNTYQMQTGLRTFQEHSKNNVPRLKLVNKHRSRLRDRESIKFRSRWISEKLRNVYKIQSRIQRFPFLTQVLHSIIFVSNYYNFYCFKDFLLNQGKPFIHSRIFDLLCGFAHSSLHLPLMELNFYIYAPLAE